ncbi:MAG: flagellar export protein FliJ [Lachnospiraceae bacterium]|nr:flagellar export protein FliJ [Lachnospiraceae bacterium]
MAKFRYKLQNILNIKQKLEDQAKQDFSTARMQLDEEEEKLEALIERRCEYEEQARKLRKGALNIRDLEENKNAILTMNDFVSAQRVEVDKAARRLEKARIRMTEAMQERKTQETLREKAFEEFLQEENRAESKVIDELTSYTYGQKQEV